ncbi:ROK family protein [Allokutzneria oryzae]|uniref:ROK family protein n=1 Tax=Allokutzneria oryzae TaxID=1378989 RepID=A0ABV5ZS88_9PSEU
MAVAPTAGTRPDEVRRHNRAALLRRLHLDGPATRAELAAELGLNRSTIKALVDELSAVGVVSEEVPTHRHGAGRPSLLVLPQAHAVPVLAVDVGVEQVSVAVAGVGGRLLGARSWTLPRGQGTPEDVVAGIVRSRVDLVDELGCEPTRAGVSVPGVVRRADGLVHEAPNLHWTGVPFGSLLVEALELPVDVGNDADLGALAEHTRGVARTSQDVVFLSADVGVGGGVILGGVSLRGSGGYVGELGHMVVNPAGRQCYCGCRGCLETEIGEDALCRALNLPTGTPRSLIVAELRSLAADDELALHRLAGFAEWLALGLTNALNLLAPELIVLGGLLAVLPPAVVSSVTVAVHRRSLVGRAAGSVRVATSSLAGDAALIGAAELAFERVFAVS